MVYRSSTEAGYGIGVSTDHVDASHADRIDIADAELLFRGHFARSGPDLVLTGQDGHRLVITGYFTTEKHPDLVAPNGAHLNGDLVDLLAGSPTPGQYAQAKTTLPPEAIGKVEKVVGQVTLIHNGVAGPLHVGDPVYKTDVVQTGANSSCGIAFPDGTALDLVNNTRMALNEYNFEPNSAANGALFSLVEGTFAFVAGQVAHTGEGMKINTPVATMGIRGTVGLFRSEPTVINSTLGHIWSAFLHEDIDGSHHLGRIAFIDMDPTSPTFGQEFFLLDSSDYIAYFEPRGPGLSPNVRLEPITNSKVFDDRHFFDDLGNILNAFATGQVNPGAVPGTPGSGDNPNSILTPPDLFLGPNGNPLFNFYGGSTGSGGPFVPFIPGGNNLPPIPTNQGQNPNPPSNGPTNNGTITPPPPAGGQNFVWKSSGEPQSWSTALGDWNLGSAPNSPLDTVVIYSGTSIYDINGNTIVDSLTIDSGATLEIKKGTLTTGTLIDNGTIIINSEPKFVINGAATIGSTDTLTVSGSGNAVDFNGSLENYGSLTASQSAQIEFNGKVTNEAGSTRKTAGYITATGVGSELDFATDVTNSGTIAVERQGTAKFEGGTVTNEAAAEGQVAGKIIVRGRGSEADFTVTSLINLGVVVATYHGTMSIDANTVINGSATDTSALIEAARHGNITITELANGSENFGTILATDWGTITLNRLGSATNESTGVIAAVDHGRIIDNVNEGTVNDGKLKAADGGEFFLKISNDDPNGVAGGNYGTMEAVDGGHFHVTGGALANFDDIKSVGPCSTFEFCDMGIGNAKLILAADQGEMQFSQVLLDNFNGGKIIADDGSINFEGGGVANGGTILAQDYGSILFKSIDGNPIDVVNSITDQNGVTTGGMILADRYGIIKFVGDDGAGTVNNDFGVMNATNHGTIIVDGIALNNSDGGLVEATCEGTVIIKGGPDVTDGGGTIAAIGWGSRVDIVDGATIAGDINNPNDPNDPFTPAPATLEADGGTIFVSSDSTLQGSINVDISGGGLADFAGGINPELATVTVDFSGSGTFALDPVSGPTSIATIVGFGKGDTIDLTNIAFADVEGFRWCQLSTGPDAYGTLTICYGDGQTETFTLDGTYCRNDFALVSDPNGDTDVVFGTIDNWTSHYSGGWTFCGNWSSGVPTDQTTAEIEYSDITTSGTVVVCLDDNKEVVGNLLIGHHGELDIGDGGSLKVLNALDDEGKILVDGHNEDPVLRLEGPVRVGDGAEITAEHRHAIIDFSFDEVGNAGKIKATHYGEITFDHAQVWNTGQMIAAHYGEIKLDDVSLWNSNEIDAKRQGIIWFDDAAINNDSDGTIGATHQGTMHIDYSTVSNDGRMGAKDGGIFDVSHTTITQGCDGYILATGGEGDSHSLVNLYDATIIGGTLETQWGGFIQTVGGNSTFDGLTIACRSEIQVSDDTSLTLEHTIDNKGTITLGGPPIGDGEDNGGGNTALVIDGWVTLNGHGDIVLSEREEQPNQDSIVSGDCGGTLDNVNNTISGAGTIGDCNLTLINGPSGIINANGDYAGLSLVVDTGHNHVVNKGLMEATHGGVLVIDSVVDNHHGTITAGNGSAVELAASVFGGTINDTGSDFNNPDLGVLVEGNQTLDYGTLNIGNNCGGSLLRNVDLTGDGATLTLGSHLTVDQTGTAGIFSTFGSADVHDLVVSYATINTSDATFTIQPDYFTNYGQINADAPDGNLDIIPTSWFKNYGTVAISNGEQATIGDGFVGSSQPGGVTNETGGVISVGEGSSLSIGNGSPSAEKAGIFVNDGTLAVYGGTAEVFGPVYGTGSDTVGDGGQLTFDSLVSAHQDVAFGGVGTVIVSHSVDFHAGISNFTAGDTFDAADIAFSAGEYDVWTQTSSSGGTLQLFNTSNVLEDTLNLNGTYAQNQFALSADQGTGTDIGILFNLVPPVTHWAGPQVVDQPGDEWSNPNNWTDGNGHVVGVPDASTDVVIEEGGGYTVEINDAEAAKSLTITPDGLGADVQDETGGSLALNGALTVDGGSFSLDGGSVTAAAIEVGANGHFIGGGTVLAPIENNAGADGGTGFVEAGHGGVGASLSFLGAATGGGTYEIDNAGSLEFGSTVASGATMVFEGPTGLLKVDDPAGFQAQIAHFTGTAPDAADSDEVELVGVWTTTSSLSGNGGNLTVNFTSGGQTASLTFDNFARGSNLTVTNDGTDTFIFDPPAKNSSPSASQTTVSASDDNFVFHPGEGAQTVTNFNAQQDTIELDHFANIQNLQELAAAITPDAHGNAVLELGHGDSVTVAGVSATYLQQHVQSLVHLH